MRDTWGIVTVLMTGLLASAGCATGAAAAGSWPMAARGARLTVPGVAFLVAMPGLPEPDLGAEVRFAALEQLAQHHQDRVGLGRAAGDVDVDLDRRTQWLGLLEQRGHAVCRHARSLVRSLDVDPLEQLAGGDAVPHRGHVARHRTVAERHQDLAARARDLHELEVVLAADRALDQGHVNALGPLLRIDQRAEHDVGLPQDG